MRSTEEIKSVICDAISNQVAAMGLTQRQAADRLGIPQPRISEIKHHRVEATIDTLLLWAAHLSIDIEIAVEIDGSYYVR